MLLVNVSILTVFQLGEEQGGEKGVEGERKRLKLVKQGRKGGESQKATR